MNFKKVENTNSKEFKEAWKIYSLSFPEDEQRTLKIQKELMKNKKYNFLIFSENKMLSAIITDWAFDEFLFVEHLAVREDLRGKGMGTKLLNEYLSKKEQKVVLEVERPDTDIAVKRIKFYEKIGFKLNKYEYIQPAYGEGKKPVPMFLMTYPEKIKSAQFKEIRQKLHTEVYGCKKPIV